MSIVPMPPKKTINEIREQFKREQAMERIRKSLNKLDDACFEVRQKILEEEIAKKKALLDALFNGEL